MFCLNKGKISNGLLTWAKLPWGGPSSGQNLLYIVSYIYMYIYNHLMYWWRNSVDQIFRYTATLRTEPSYGANPFHVVVVVDVMKGCDCEDMDVTTQII
jgi:hypothetical protein